MRNLAQRKETMSDFLIASVLPGKLNALVKIIMEELGLEDPNEAVRLINSQTVFPVHKDFLGERGIDGVRSGDTVVIDKNLLADIVVRVPTRRKLISPEGFTGRFIDKDLILSGPSEYRITNKNIWRHEYQSNEDKWGFLFSWLYEHLQDNHYLINCASLHDLEAIRKMGREFFRFHFKIKGIAVYAWRSVIERDTTGGFEKERLVPCLKESYEKKLVIQWKKLSDNCRGIEDVALRY